MDGMFTSPSRPFYQSVTIINLQPLRLPIYTAFSERKFKEAGKTLDPAVVGELYARFEAVTSYMHRVLNVLFSKTQPGERCTVDMVDLAIEYILRMSSDTYEALLYQMPEKQRAVFIAIAAEGKAKEVTSAAFLKKHRLPSASSVSSAVKGLLEKDFITLDKGMYMAYDQFFVLWMKYKGGL